MVKEMSLAEQKELADELFMEMDQLIKEKKMWEKLDLEGRYTKDRHKSRECLEKQVAKRRKRNKNKKTHRK